MVSFLAIITEPWEAREEQVNGIFPRLIDDPLLASDNFKLSIVIVT